MQTRVELLGVGIIPSAVLRCFLVVTFMVFRLFSSRVRIVWKLVVRLLCAAACPEHKNEEAWVYVRKNANNNFLVGG